MKNNKGFTLVELIISIVLMLSLTILVVVGFTKVSDSKKEEADKLTVSQIETAAEQYFSTNYYWIEYLKKGNKDDFIHVNLAQLIKDDYLNVVSSVSTEQKYSKCDIVKVTYDKTSNKLNFAYSDEFKGKDSCNPKIELAGPLSITYEVVSGIKKLDADPRDLNAKQWYTSDIRLKVKVRANEYEGNVEIDGATVEKNNYIKKVNIMVNNRTVKNVNLVDAKGNYTKEKECEIDITLSDEGPHNVFVTAQNADDAEYPSSSVFYKDSVAPTANITAYVTDSNKTGFTDPTTIESSKILNNNTWTKSKIYSVAIGQDSVSGIYKGAATKCEFNGGMSGIIYGNSGNTYGDNKYGLYLRYTNDAVGTMSCVFYDNAGNVSSPVTYNIKRDTVAPTITFSSNQSKNLDDMKNHTATTAYSSGTWYNGFADAVATATDSKSAVTLNYVRTNDGNGGSGARNVIITSNGAGQSAVSRDYSYAEGTSYYSYTATDAAGNSTTISHTIKLDRTAPTCSVSASGTAGNVVNNRQWYLTNNVTVSLSARADQAHRSGLNTYGLSTGSKTYNTTTSGTQSSEGLVTWNCYVKDNAGNEGSNSITFGLEKTVHISFNAGLTNLGTSEGQNYGKLVFNASKNGPCGYGTCSNIKCRTNGNSEYCASGRFARACRYVKSYPRFFTVTAASEYTTPTLTYASDSDKSSVTISGTTYYQNNRITRMDDYKRDNASDEFGKNYDYRYVGTSHGSGTNDFSAHRYQYTSPAGLKSNGVRLYTEYGTECY